MQKTFSNFQEFFKSIQIFHGAMFVGMVLIMVILKFILGVEDNGFPQDYLFTLIGVVAGLTALVAGHLLFTRQINELKMKAPPVMERLAGYQTAFIMKLALLEGSALICMILHFLEGTSILFYTFLFLLVMFALYRPTVEKVQASLGLTKADIR